MAPFLSHYSALAWLANAQKKLRWSVVPKHQYAAHLPEQAAWCNPRLLWASGGESMVGKIAALGHSCLAGTAAEKVAARILPKYRVAMHLRLTSYSVD